MLVKILNEELTKQIQEIFDGQLIHPVELLFFFENDTCDTCDETERLLDEISSLSSKIQVRKYDMGHNQPVTEKYHIHMAPGLVIAGGGPAGTEDYGIRFTGIPSGYEFGSLIQAIIMVSKRDSALKPAVRKELTGLTKPVHLKVFVTPT